MKAIVCALVIGLTIPSFAGAAIENIKASNNDFGVVTISWTTDGEVMGEVHYSENQDLSNPVTAYDVREPFFSGCTHYVDIAGLTEETLYYFEVVAGGETDNNEGQYYTFRTMVNSQQPPSPCFITGCVYEDDGTTLALGAMVYLWVTHGSVESYPLSDLLGSPGDATPGCFAIDLKEARSIVTNDLFPSIDPGDLIHIEVIGCGNYRAESDQFYSACFNNIGNLTLEYTLPGTTTTTADPTTTTTADSSTTTTADPTTTTTADSSTTTTVPAATTSIPGTTTSVPGTTTSVPGGGCATDEECDDGLYCNGVETCDPEAGCRPGSAPCTADGAFCNGVEGCDEEADACVSSGDPCEENEICREEDDTCEPAMGIEVSITGCGLPLFARLGVVEIQGTLTDFKALSVVQYDSPLVIKSLKLLNRNTQTITQFVLMMPSIFFPAWDYPAMVPVTVGSLSGNLTIPACGQ